MKILYFANHGNTGSDNTESHIKYALEKQGHQVVCINEGSYSKSDVVSQSKDADLFLFHKGGVQDGITFMKFIELIGNVTCKKVCWYFDKIWGDREAIIENLLPYIDGMFVTDETWARRHGYKNVKVLHQGIGTEDTSPGKFNPGLESEIAFVGQIYGDRIDLVTKLKDKYGERLRIFNNIFNRDLYDLAASTKVFIAPDSPGDDFYWSSRVYMVLGSGGFLIHPEYEGLKKEFKNKQHLAYYKGFEDLCEKIDYYLSQNKKRKAIQEKGYEECVKNHNYEVRCQELLTEMNFGEQD